MSQSENKKLNRKNYFCNDEMNNFVKSTSAEMGISESAFVNICIDNYYNQRMAIKTMSNLPELMARLEALEKK